jgi:hypothetical protein
VNQRSGTIPKRRTILLGALCGAFGLLVLISVQGPSDAGADRSGETSTEVSAEAQSPDPESDPVATPEAPSIVPEISPGNDQVVAGKNTNAESCAEVTTRFPSLRVHYPDGEVDEDRCARTLQILGPPVPALPGLGGFEIRNLPFSPRTLLFEESDNPEWSRAMEGRILGEISTLLDFPILMVHAVCRSATCGVLFANTAASYSGGRRNLFAQELAEALDFTAYTSGESRPRGGGAAFTVIYLGAWSTLSEDITGPPRRLPTTFEDIGSDTATELDQRSP